MGSYATSDDGQTPWHSSSYAPIWEPKIITTAHAMGYFSGPALSVASVGWCLQHSPKPHPVLRACIAARPKVVAQQRRFAQKNFEEWGQWRRGRDCEGYVLRQHQSYAIHLQGDLDAPETVLGSTRNIRGFNHNGYYRSHGGHSDKQRWLFSHYPVRWVWIVYRTHLRGNHNSQFYGPGSQRHSAGLETGQGNWVTSGGEVTGSSQEDFKTQLDRARQLPRWLCCNQKALPDSYAGLISEPI